MEINFLFIYKINKLEISVIWMDNDVNQCNYLNLKMQF